MLAFLQAGRSGYGQRARWWGAHGDVSATSPGDAREVQSLTPEDLTARFEAEVASVHAACLHAVSGRFGDPLEIFQPPAGRIDELLGVPPYLD